MQKKGIKYTLEVCDSLFNPYEPFSEGEKKKAYYKEAINAEGRKTIWYKVWIYLDGQDLPFVKDVTYKLHPTFPNPMRNIECTPDNPKAAFFIWTWGIFTVEAEITDLKGRNMHTSHYLTYNSHLRDENIEWIKI